jgi:hypothetical protein
VLKKSLHPFADRLTRKLDLSDRSTNRSWASVRGKKTPENLAELLMNEFFNGIGQ